MEHPNPAEKWKNMRRMAWVAFAHALTAVFYIDDNTTLMYLLTFDASVVGAYMGFSTVGNGWGK